MKIFLAAVLISAATAGMAFAQGGMGNPYSACAHSNSKHCQDARAAFAEHHNGMSPDQWYNQYYQGRQGRWSQEGKNWRWESMNGEKYEQVHNKWAWVGGHHHKHDHDDDHDHDNH